MAAGLDFLFLSLLFLPVNVVNTMGEVFRRCRNGNFRSGLLCIGHGRFELVGLCPLLRASLTSRTLGFFSLTLITFPFFSHSTLQPTFRLDRG